MTDVDSRSEDLGGDATKRAEARPERHASKKSVCKRCEYPSALQGQKCNAHGYNSGGDNPCRGLIDRIGELKADCHAGKPSDPNPTKQLNFYQLRWPLCHKALPTGHYGRGMTLRLRVVQSAWESTARQVATEFGSVIPVVKGNGYGFGRSALMPLASSIAADYGDAIIGVGTVYEAADVPDGFTAMVLTPHLGELPVTLTRDVVLTVGSSEHVDSLAHQGWDSPVVVKVQSSMRRHGVEQATLPDLVARANAAGLNVIGFSFHPPLLSADNDNVDEVRSFLRDLPPNSTVFLSHLAPDSCNDLQSEFDGMTMSIRVGTALWHADKTQMHLSADVLSVDSVTAGTPVGYRRTETEEDGTVVVIGAGTAHGVDALDGGLSPFHFARRRLHMIEKPHMHSSMVFIPDGASVPSVGDWIDVQRPLITVTPDELQWVSASTF